MREYLDWLRLKISFIPRMVRYIVSGLAFMVLGIILSKYDPNVIYFIFSAMLSLLGLVLFMMGLINGALDLARHIKYKLSGNKTINDTK